MGRTIFHTWILIAVLHLLLTSKITPLASSLSAEGVSSSGEETDLKDISSSSSAPPGTCHESITSRLNKNVEDVIGDEQISPEGDLASQFGLGHSGGALSFMASNAGSRVTSSATKPLPEFAIDYGNEVVAHNEQDREIALTFDHRGGARWRSHVQFESGTFNVKIKTPEGDTSGLNTSFYLSSLEGDKSQDEIDFEFLGKDKWIVQTNYYTLGKGNREEIHQLGFDSSLDFHEYTIRWSPGKIEWLIDGEVVRSTAQTKDAQDQAFPVKPMYLYASLWNAGDIDGGKWAGSYTGSHAPYVCKYRDVQVPAVNHNLQSAGGC